ncbi:MAG: response regulator [Eubacteriales bacterium]|nr:response regulator [Eubacteriales bacterium]
MYRIVIADDEEYVRELVAKNINQSGREFVVVGKAENGEEAIDLVKELEPDILITDICMPIVSGLELVRQIRELDRSIKTVIISGYDDFSYAKQAVSLGVTEYLLKPFLPEELLEVLDKIGEELQRQKTLVTNMQEMQNQIRDNLHFRQENLIRKLLKRKISEEQFPEECRKAEMNLPAPFYAVGILRVSADVSGLLAVVKDEYFPKEVSTCLAEQDERQSVILFAGTCRNARTFERYIREGMEQLSESMERYYDRQLCCAVGQVYEDWKQIPESYQEARSVWNGILDFNEAVVFYQEQIKARSGTESNGIERPVELENNLLVNIQMGRTEQALEILGEILQYYQLVNVRLSEFVSISLVEMVFHISGTLRKAGGDVQLWKNEDVVEYLKKHFAYGSLSDAREVLEQYVTRCCEQFAMVNEKQGDRIVYNVKELIEKNLANEEFNLESASAQLFFSHNYVRQIFKQITGESFTEYLIRRRMETARELLQNQTYKIQDVAIRTGYSNQRYFASCFKKYYGCTPTEYRNSLK